MHSVHKINEYGHSTLGQYNDLVYLYYQNNSLNLTDLSSISINDICMYTNFKAVVFLDLKLIHFAYTVSPFIIPFLGLQPQLSFILTLYNVITMANLDWLNIHTFSSSTTLGSSLTYRRNNTGLKLDPYVTPVMLNRGYSTHFISSLRYYHLKFLI